MTKGLLFIVLATLAVGVQLADAAWREVQTAVTVTGLNKWTHSSFRTSGPCLDFSEATANGESADAQLWDCSNRWDGKRSPHDHTVGYEDTSGWAWIRHRHNNVDYCLDVTDGDGTERKLIRWWKCNGSRAQAWYIPTGGKTGVIRTDLDYSLYVADYLRMHWNRVSLRLAPCVDVSDYQLFGLAMGKGYSDGWVHMRNDCEYALGTDPECTFSCKTNEKWKQYWYDGVTYSCRRRPSTGMDECISSLNPAQYPHDWGPGAPCQCGKGTEGASSVIILRLGENGRFVAPNATKTATKTAAPRRQSTAAPTLEVRSRH
ncbi:hypothetical protein H9P43_007174 [Blastocladiella emersonii ATCC 22665]|nr:hypothetical protein H9P43_007174 [Blastocladiella emersonii ATCC 22665]